MANQKKRKILVYLRGGHVVTVYCDDWSTKFASDGHFAAYTYKGLSGGPVCLSLPDIVAWQEVEW